MNDLQTPGKSRRGLVFFWIVQVLLLPAWICFVITGILRFGGSHPLLWKAGVVTGLLQVPCTALALLFALASGMGDLLPRSRLRVLYGSTVVTVVLVTLVFVWRGVYRR